MKKKIYQRWRWGGRGREGSRNLPKFSFLHNLDSAPAERVRVYGLLHLGVAALTQHLTHHVVTQDLKHHPSRGDPGSKTIIGMTKNKAWWPLVSVSSHPDPEWVRIQRVHGSDSESVSGSRKANMSLRTRIKCRNDMFLKVRCSQWRGLEAYPGAGKSFMKLQNIL